MKKPIIVVHGGTGKTPANNEEERRTALEEATEAGRACLERGESAVEAVYLAVRLLESSGLFEAGAGSSPQLDGIIRQDASLMCSEGRAGGVIGVVGVQSAIEGARRIYDRPIEHTTLAGSDASLVLKALGVKVAPFPTRRREVHDCVQAYIQGMPDLYGTVGAVALDVSGRLAAATSTGGYPTALPGRTGDSGIIAAGTYATPRCALSCTGNGDRIVPSGIAVAIDAYIECGLRVIDAADRAMQRLAHWKGDGGFILLTSDGQVIIRSNVPVIRAASNHRGADDESQRWLLGG
jgi:beta-aspartyl-peptidase (threonine type)